MYSRRNSRFHTLVPGVPFLTILGIILFGNPLFEGNDDPALIMVAPVSGWP